MGKIYVNEHFSGPNISGTAERICAKSTGNTCLVPRSDEFEFQGKSQGHQGQKRRFSADISAMNWFARLRAVYVW